MPAGIKWKRLIDNTTTGTTGTTTTREFPGKTDGGDGAKGFR